MRIHFSTPQPLITAVSLFLLSACGGTTHIEPGDAGISGGAGLGGNNAGITGGAQSAGGKSSVGGTGVGGDGVCCLAMPVCNAGDVQISSQSSCPANAQCYPLSICCSQIWCAKTLDAGACNPSAEYFRHYVSSSATQCQVIDYACPANTTMFGNACGCGCQQETSCPQYVDCMPGPTTADPLCSDTARCPYSIRAL